MREDNAPPQINVSKIAVGGGFAGAFFAAASMSIFLIGVPLIRYLFPVAVLVGFGVALVIRLTRHEKSSTARILTVAKK